MRVYFLHKLAAVILSIPPFVAVGQARALPPSADASTQTISLGARLPGRVIPRTLRIRNTANQPLHFSLLRTSCGCLSAKVAPTTVAPGALATLSLRIVTHELPGPSQVSAVLVGNEGTARHVWQYSVTYTVRRMIQVFPPGPRFGSPVAIDLGIIKQRALGRPITLSVVRGGFPARWDTLLCRVVNRAGAVSVRKLRPGRWSLRLSIIDHRLLGTQSFPLRFTFLDHGKPLAYHLTEPVVFTATGALSLVPSSLLVGTLKPDEKFHAMIKLWSRDASIIPRFLSAESTAKQMTTSITNGGRGVAVPFIPGQNRGPISGEIQFKVQYGSKVVNLHGDYFAYVLKRHGEPIPRQMPR